MCQSIEKKEKSLYAEEVAFALTGIVACPANYNLLIYPEIMLLKQPLFH
jgi:hypothetical protein